MFLPPGDAIDARSAPGVRRFSAAGRAPGISSALTSRWPCRSATARLDIDRGRSASQRRTSPRHHRREAPLGAGSDAAPSGDSLPAYRARRCFVADRPRGSRAPSHLERRPLVTGSLPFDLVLSTRRQTRAPLARPPCTVTDAFSPLTAGAPHRERTASTPVMVQWPRQLLKAAARLRERSGRSRFTGGSSVRDRTRDRSPRGAASCEAAARRHSSA